jgi:phage gp45-like
MGLVPGRVLRSAEGMNRDGNHQVLMVQSVVSNPRDVRLVELTNPLGRKSNPPAGSKLVIGSIGTSWKVALACDDLQQPAVNPGEVREYSTAEDGGAAVTQIYFKNDGTLVVTADVKVEVQAPEVDVVADTKVTITTPVVEVQADTEVTITAPEVVITGDVVVEGALVASGGIASGSGTPTPGNLSVDGDITADGDVVGNGISLDSHVHSDPEGGTTGAPQ